MKKISIPKKSLAYFLLAATTFFVWFVFSNYICAGKPDILFDDGCGGWWIFSTLFFIFMGISFFVLGMLNFFIKGSISENKSTLSQKTISLNKDVSLWAVVLGIILFLVAPYLGYFLFSYVGFSLFILGFPGAVRKFFPNWFHIFSLVAIILILFLSRVFGFL